MECGKVNCVEFAIPDALKLIGEGSIFTGVKMIEILGSNINFITLVGLLLILTGIFHPLIFPAARSLKEDGLSTNGILLRRRLRYKRKPVFLNPARHKTLIMIVAISIPVLINLTWMVSQLTQEFFGWPFTRILGLYIQHCPDRFF